jgi:hypothetical protein
MFRGPFPPSAASRCVAQLACLALFFCVAANAGADTSSARFIPARCQLVVHVDFERWIAEREFSSLALMFQPPQASPEPDIAAFTSFSFGVALAPSFSASDMMAGKPIQGVTFYVALKSASSLDAVRADLERSGMSWRDQGGRRYLVNSLNDFSVCFSDDGKIALAAKGEGHAEEMLGAQAGANATSKPGFGAGATAGTIFYLYAADLEKEIGQLASFFAAAVASNAGGDAAKDPLVTHQAELLALGRARVVEFALTPEAANMKMLFRAAMPNEADAAAAAKALGLLVDRARAAEPVLGAFPAPAATVAGDVAIMAFSQPKNDFGQAISGFWPSNFQRQ